MTFFSKLKRAAAIGAAGLAAGAVLTGAAHAQTTANTSVDNTFTLDYSVGAVPQDQITNDPGAAGPGVIVQGTPTNFTVDRRVDLSLVQTNSPESASPGETGQQLTFTLTNEGNDNAAYSLDVVRNTGDDFDATVTSTLVNYEVFNSGGASLGTGTLPDIALGTATTTAGQRTIDVPPNGTVDFVIISTIPSGVNDGDVDEFTLIAEARDPVDWVQGPPASPGTTATGTAGNLTLDDSAGDASNQQSGAADNVLADENDAAVGADADNDGRFGAVANYVVASPDLVAEKTVTTIATVPTACATQSADAGEQYPVPGACVEYRITVVNTGGAATAANLDIRDVLPDELTFLAVSEITGSWTDPSPPGTTFTGTNGFEDDPAAPNGGTTGPLLTLDGGAPTTTDCAGATVCEVRLNDAILAAGEVGIIVILATVN